MIKAYEKLHHAGFEIIESEKITFGLSSTEIIDSQPDYKLILASIFHEGIQISSASQNFLTEFNEFPKKMQQIKEEMQREDILDTVGANILWKDIREAFEEDEAYWKDNEDVNWIFNFKKGKTNVKDKKIELTK